MLDLLSRAHAQLVRGLLALLVTVGPECQDHIFGGADDQGVKGRVLFILRKQSLTSQLSLIESSLFLFIEV